MKKVIKYINPPAKCQNCNKPFSDTMYDAKTVYGSWGNLCSDCFNVLGLGIGTGLGQQYIQNEQGEWIKNAG